MHINVKLHGNLKRYAPNAIENASLQIEDGLSIRALLSRFQVPDAEVWLCAINGTVVNETAALNDGDVLEVFEPVGGGELDA